MRRMVVLALVCVVFGVVVNYGVAWRLMFVRADPVQSQMDIRTGLTHRPWPHPVPDDWPEAPMYRHDFVGDHFTLSHAWFVGRADPNQIPVWRYQVEQLRIGWPSPCLVSSVLIVKGRLYGVLAQPSGITLTSGWRVPASWELLDSDPSDIRAGFLPLAPLWPGFAYNTLLFASIPALILLPWGPLKRHRRRRRGACLKCGYDLSATDASVCPECGGAP